jgi:hypothetical protein
MSQLFSEYLVEPSSAPQSPSQTFIIQLAESTQTNERNLVEVHHYLIEKVISFWRCFSKLTIKLRKIQLHCVDNYRDFCETLEDFQVDLRRSVDYRITKLSQSLKNCFSRLKHSVFIHLIQREALPIK